MSYIQANPDSPELSPAIPWHLVHLFWGDERWVGVTDVLQAAPPVPRVSLTLPALNAARNVVFAVSGEAKR